MKTHFAIIGDIHFGIPETERLYQELGLFIEFIKNNEVDVIQINGDYFHRKLSLTESATIRAIEFFNRILEIAVEKKIKIRIIEGTMSHDLMMPEILEEIASHTDVDFKFIRTCDTEIINGIDILYIPEEYPLNAEEFYHPFRFNEDGSYKQYDLIFMHGMLDNTGLSMLENKANSNTEHSAPFFVCDDWVKNIEHGKCFASHYHARQVSKDNKFIYIGSYTAWSFVQVSEKGWGYAVVDSETHNIDYSLPVNTLAPHYVDIKIEDLGLDLEKTSADKIVEAINKYKDDHKIDYFKIFVSTLSIDKLELLKKTFANNKNINIETKERKMLKTSNSNTTKELENKYQYILDDKMPIAETVHRYIKEEYKEDVTVPLISSTISEA